MSFVVFADLDATMPLAPQKAPSMASLPSAIGLFSIVFAIPSPPVVFADGINKQSYPPFLPSAPSRIEGYVQ